MSSGKTHLKVSLFLAAGFSLAATIYSEPRLLECAIGSATGVLIGPDLDVDNGNISNKIVKQRVGWFGEKIWRWFWRGYSGSFKHGQFASHFPVFSTFIRLSYIYFWTVVPFYLASLALKPTGYYFDFWHELIWWAEVFFHPAFFIGLCFSDTAHFLFDILTKEKSH